MKNSVKQIIMSKVTNAVNESNLTKKQKEELMASINTAVNSKDNAQAKISEDGLKVYDAFLCDYVKVEHMSKKKVKLKDGSIVERYNSMTNESAKLKKLISTNESKLKDELVKIAMSETKDKNKRLKELQKQIDLLGQKEIEALIKTLNK